MNSDAPPDALAHATDGRVVVERLITKHRQEFLRFVTHRAPTGVQPDDILQQATLRALQHPEALHDPARGRAWFYAIVRHVMADARLLRELPFADVPEPAQSPREEVVHEACRCSISLLETLKPEYQQALKLVDLQGEPLGALASSLGISVNNATVRLHRARSALRSKLMAHCGVQSARECLDCSCGE